MTTSKCCYCDVNPATTRDHVPPKGIFNKPRPSDLITVPSCLQCNNEASGYDERFKVYLGMHVARLRDKGEVLFKKGVLPTIRHNRTLRDRIIRSLKPVSFTNNAGKIVETGASVLWDSEAHDAVIERITKGLFFHHFKQTLKTNATIKISWFHQLPDVLNTISFEVRSIGNGDFVYAFAKVDGSDDSIWLYQFYNGHWSGASIAERVT